MRYLLLLILLIPLTALAKEKEGYCNEGNESDMQECASKKLVESDTKLKREVKSNTFEKWIGIRQKMCEEAYRQFPKNTVEQLMILKCSIKMNKTLLQKMSGINN